jgi:hypothetical protein
VDIDFEHLHGYNERLCLGDLKALLAKMMTPGQLETLLLRARINDANLKQYCVMSEHSCGGLQDMNTPL